MLEKLHFDIKPP